MLHYRSFFFFTDTPPTDIYTLSLHDALPISRAAGRDPGCPAQAPPAPAPPGPRPARPRTRATAAARSDRKSTRLNSSHEWISYAVFCLKKKNNNDTL